MRPGLIDSQLSQPLNINARLTWAEARPVEAREPHLQEPCTISAATAAQARYGWQEQASTHAQTSVRCYSIVNRIDQFLKKTQYGAGDRPGDDVCVEARSIMDDFSDTQISALTTEELEFFDRIISTHGIR
jgi:hypothetical protein